ncbi:MAG: hypothetical protein V3W41_11900 [Planctomycetota bacterium]
MSRLIFPFAFLLLTASFFAQQGSDEAPDFVNYESGQVHPMAVSADGKWLYALNTPNSCLSILSLANPRLPVLKKEIFVGLEPVSLCLRNEDEIWVVENLSDAVSVVSLKEGRVTATIRVGDEPNDIIFAGSPERAYVSISGEDLICVIDPQSHERVATIPILGKTPRALATNGDGSRVYTLAFHSGNRTTLVPIDPAPAPPLPAKKELRPAPKTSLIVSLTNPVWNIHPMNLVDYDAFEIDTKTMAVTKQIKSVGTTNFDLVYDSDSKALFVVNADSRNRFRFEPAVNGHVIDNRVSRVSLGDESQVQHFDVNPGVDYSLLPNPAARKTALADLTSIVMSENGRLFVTAQGSDRIGILSKSGEILGRIDVSEAPMDGRDTLNKRGPRALAFHLNQSILYCYNRLSHTIAVIDVEQQEVGHEVSIGFDPTPPYIRDGRKFLYEARIAGNGTMSCASCHIDGDADFLVWDLGDPNGDLMPVPQQKDLDFMPKGSSPAGFFHPMKGPMITQTMRGLDPNPPFHWRGDKQDLTGFNDAFVSLHGGDRIPHSEMKMYERYLLQIAHAPNPHRGLDNGLSEAAQKGEFTFNNTIAIDFPDHTLVKCVDCHSNPDGANNHIFMPVRQAFLGIPQPINTPQLRGIYRRGEAKIDGSPSKVGFGYANDGNFPTLRAFLDLVTFNAMPDAEKDDLAEFIRAWDTGTAPAVGFRLALNAKSIANPDYRRDIETLEWQAALGKIDLIAKGLVNGVETGLLFDPAKRTYATDQKHGERIPRATMEILAAKGGVDIIFTGVAPGCGQRSALDHDRDGVLNGEPAKAKVKASSEATGKSQSN